MCDYTRPRVSVLILLIFTTTAAAFPAPLIRSLSAPPEVTAEIEVTTFQEATPTWKVEHLFNSVSSGEWKPTVVTVSEGDPLTLGCLKGASTTFCTSESPSKCTFAWLKVRNKKYFKALRPWTGLKLLEKSGLLANDLQRDLQGPILVIKRTTRDHAGLYICKVTLEGPYWTKGVAKGFDRKFLVRVMSEGSRATKVKQETKNFIRAPEGAETVIEEEAPTAMEFGMIKYVFGLGSTLANFAFFGLCLTLLPCLCCSGLSSLCCCF